VVARVVPTQISPLKNSMPVLNEILLGLPRKEYDIVFPLLEPVGIQSHQILNELSRPIEYCFFVNSGLVSVVNAMRDGKTVEVGLTGKEGFVGLPVVVGLRTSPSRGVMQVSGSAFRLRTTQLAQILGVCPQLEKKLNRYSQYLALQATQIAACNQLHDVEERLARWLLMSQDRIGSDLVPLTQELLARMLGTRRASVTVAAGVLQKAGLIRYTRGSVGILNRKRLEDAACECYAALRQQSQLWKSEER